MLYEYDNNTVPRCKFCHPLQPTHAKQKAAARDREGDRPLTKAKHAINNAWKHERGECFYCQLPVRDGQEAGFHWMHKQEHRNFSIGSSMANESEPVESWKKRVKPEVATCKLGCANCHEKYETVRERKALKNVRSDLIEALAQKRARTR